jgi:hypothetical protein
MSTRCASLQNKPYRAPSSPKPSLFPAVQKYLAGVAFVLAMTPLSSFAQINVTVNYGATGTTGTPVLFGGSNEPNPGDDASFYPQATAAGVNFERCVIHVDQVVPSGITLAEFEANTNGVADPANWTWGPISGCTNAHAQGWKVMANLENAPAWLTYDGSVLGVPTNWSVWQQIVTGIVEKLGSNINYLELLNEPTNFLYIADSPYTTLQSAVDAYYYYGAVAARAANGSVLIGGDGDASGTTQTMIGLVEDTQLTSNLLQFVSFHSYGSNAAGQYNLSSLESTLSSNGRANLPIFVTEWNYTASSTSNAPEVVGNQAVNWVAYQLMVMTGQPQLTGASYFSFLPNNEPVSPYEECSGCDNYQLAFYSGSNGVATLLPQARAYRLLSVDLGLGTGAYRTYPTVNATVAEEGWILASNGAVSAAVSNETATATTVNFTLEGIDTSGCNFTVNAYLADTGSNTAVSPVATYNNVCITNKTLTLNGVAIPAYAVLGIAVY